MIDLTKYIDCFLIFDFSTSWLEVKMINFNEYNVFVDFSTSCWEDILIDFTAYIEFFDFSTSYWELK